MTFDNFIASELKSGRSIENLAEDFTRALNAARKEMEERERAERELEKTREAFIDIINAAVDVNNFDNKVAAAACTLAFIDNNKTTKQEVDKYYSEALRALNGGKASADRREPQVVEIKAEDLDRAWKKLIGDAFGVKPNKPNNSKEDAETIEKFLRGLGL